VSWFARVTWHLEADPGGFARGHWKGDRNANFRTGIPTKYVVRSMY
jgi:hypothetical protein